MDAEKAELLVGSADDEKYERIERYYLANIRFAEVRHFVRKTAFRLGWGWIFRRFNGR